MSTTNRAASQENLCNAARVGDVLERIAIQYEKVRPFTRGEYAAVLEAQVLRAAAPGGRQPLHPRPARLDHQLQLAVFGEAERIVLQTGIAAEHDARARIGELLQAVLPDGVALARGRCLRRRAAAIRGEDLFDQ